MVVTAKLNYLRIAPRKVRLAADLIRGKSVEEAQTILSFTTKRAALPVLKLIKSAVNSAKNNFHLDGANLYISKITVDEGPKFKRFFPRARGQAYEIQKRTSHITLVLDQIKPGKIKKVKKTEKEKELAAKETKLPKEQKPKFKYRSEKMKPRTEKGVRRTFRRKAF